ncbi:MAG: hypothetical protein ACD_79C01432G0007 [uncultured bacterium]|nr:MAG: hypothetical protein ACD_79C01432G0007 [uncultured bacterium]
MDKNKIIKKIKEILVDEILVPFKEKDIDSSESLIKTYGIDSIQMMELLVCLEDEFKVSFEEENIEIEILNSIDSLTDFILKKSK